MIKVLVAGALGRMGTEVCKKVCSEEGLELVGGVDIKETTITPAEGVTVGVTTDIEAAIAALKPDVVVDFTRPNVVMGNLRKVLPLGVHCVVGTTGFKPADLEEVDALAKANNTGLLIAPNFALGAVVMMKLA
ncbi:MAG: 4-hydroxy-tetrahydrodipicolinate reductase, partial [Phascolarctobacterium sp.]|nr:4-hydroxy-tetrahydrodipicolinate reductase [Phascolarctobacterium sp.]